MVNQQAVLYIRQLPGGGYVSIEGRMTGSAAPYRASLCVERRSIADRRDGHPPPVIFEESGPDQQIVFDRLLKIANSNVEVAAALLRWQSEQQKTA